MKELALIDNALLADGQYPVDFNDAWEWVGYSRKDVALEMLKANFVDVEDFNLRNIVEVQIEGTRKVKRPMTAITLTSDCFKEFCMMAGTDKGREVRRYFIAAEKRLRQVIDDNRLNKRIRRELTDAIQTAKENGHKDMHGWEYKVYTDMIYKAVLGMTAKKYREATGLPEKENVKPHLTVDQTKRVNQLDKIVTSLLDGRVDYEQIKEILEKQALPVKEVV